MTGNWSGYYRYDKQDVQKIIGFEKTFFTLTITSFDGTHFKGIVNDDTNTGGMKDTGEVAGYVDKNKIFFKKFMPKRNIIVDRKGTTKTTATKHPTLYYSGMFSEDRKEMSGHWKFKYSIGLLFGFIPILFRPGKGSWSMKFEN